MTCELTRDRMGVVPLTAVFWLAARCSNTSSNVGGGVLQHEGDTPGDRSRALANYCNVNTIQNNVHTLEEACYTCNEHIG